MHAFQQQTEIPELLIGGANSAGHQGLPLHFANRHGLITGATGTGKTVTLQVLAEGFSRAGVPVFVADVKGDLSGIAAAGKPHPKVDERIEKIGIEGFNFAANATIFWDVYGEQGHPIRTTISEMGPLLLSRLMQLSDAQEGALHIAFAAADDEGLLLLDLKDLRQMLQFMMEHRKELNAEYGHYSNASVGAIQRRLLMLEEAGGEQFFGEPALTINDLLRTDISGRGMINVLAADKLIRNPRLYSTFLLWLLSELFEQLPEVGDQPKPRMAFFFDEAHLLFQHTSPALIETIEQVVRLIRSKGVGVYFVTQHPSDLPDSVLAQLGNRVLHALRGFTPKERKAIKAVADSCRPNPDLDSEQVLTELKVGEALVSTLQEGGAPGMVQRTLICPPESRIGPLDKSERTVLMQQSPVNGLYDREIDRESAYELLTKRAEAEAAQAEKERESAEQEQSERKTYSRTKRRSTRQGYLETTVKSVLRTVGNRLGREIVRGLLGNILK